MIFYYSTTIYWPIILVYVIARGQVELRINFHAYFQSFHKIARVAQRRGQFVKTLKIQVKFILNSTRTQCNLILVYNTEGKIFGNFSMHVETQSAGPRNKSTRS